MEIPQEARIIYRNKDGTIRTQSREQELEEHQKAVLSRLAEWEQGMAVSDSSANEAEEDYLIKRQVWDDPMRQFDAPAPVKLFTCSHPAPANRFDIKPGFRWDGVVRGNGFESKLLQTKSLQKAT